MEEINALRQQLAAAEFLVNSLRAQLQRAENQYATAQQFHHHHIPRLSSAQETRKTPRSGLESNLQDNLEGGFAEALNGDDYAPDVDRNLAGHLDLELDGDATLNDAPGEQLDEEESEPPEPPEPGNFPIPEGVDLPVLEVKTVYPTLGNVKAAVEAYAVAQGWTPATKKRDHLRICMGCRTTKTCPYHIRAETCEEGARISASKLGHTCGGNAIAMPKRQQTSRLRFLHEEVPKFMELTRETPTKGIQEAVFQRYGMKISIAQCTKLRGRKRYKRPAFQGCGRCGEAGHNRATCKA